MTQQPGNPERQAKQKACRDEAATVYRGSRANNQILGRQRRAHVQQCLGRQRAEDRESPLSPAERA
jgi:hypothetical protein